MEEEYAKANMMLSNINEELKQALKKQIIDEIENEDSRALFLAIIDNTSDNSTAKAS